MSSMPSSVPLSSNSPIPACHTVNSHDNTLQPLQTWWMCLEALACHIKHNTSRRLGNGITLLVTTSGSWRQEILLLLEPVVACQHAQRSTSLTTAAKVKVPVPASNEHPSCILKLHS